MKIGYARVSTQDQDLKAQQDALEQAGCERIYQEKFSAGTMQRPELEKVLELLRPGDVLVVWKLDRLSRSLKDMLTITEMIKEAGAGFISLTEAIETTTPAGCMLAQMLGSFAEFERAMARERTLAGLAKARAEGKKLGPRYKLNPTQRMEVLRMVLQEGKSCAEVGRLFGVHRTTIRRLAEQGRGAFEAAANDNSNDNNSSCANDSAAGEHNQGNAEVR